MSDLSAGPFPGHHDSSGGHRNCRFDRAGRSSVPGAVLPGAVLPGAGLPGAGLPGAGLPGAVLPGAGKARRAVAGSGPGSRSYQRSRMDCPYSRLAGQVGAVFGKQHIGGGVTPL